jgi:hypothetical protein
MGQEQQKAVNEALQQNFLLMMMMTMMPMMVTMARQVDGEGKQGQESDDLV